MTQISFEATYDVSTLHKMKTAELKNIWMTVCSPPTVKDQLIREILFFQKKNRSEELKLQNSRKTDSSSKSDKQATKVDASFGRRSVSRLDFAVKSNHMPKKKSATERRDASKSKRTLKVSGRKSRVSEPQDIRRRKYNSVSPEKNLVFIHSSDESDKEGITNKAPLGRPQLRKPHSYHGGFIRWITGSEKVEKMSDQDIDHIDRKNVKDIERRKYQSQAALAYNSSRSRTQRVNTNRFSSVGKLNLQQRNKNTAEILDVDIQLDGLDAIPDIEKQRAREREKSTGFKIRSPSRRVLIDNFKSTAV